MKQSRKFEITFFFEVFKQKFTAKTWVKLAQNFFSLKLIVFAWKSFVVKVLIIIIIIITIKLFEGFKEKKGVWSEMITSD